MFETSDIFQEHLRDMGGGARLLDLLSQVTPRRKRKDFSDMRFLIAHALSNGAIMTSEMTCEWNIAASCSSPYRAEWHAPPPKGMYLGPGSPGSLTLVLHTRCRKCDRCRRARAALWRMRAEQEMRISCRTWFATFTLAPSDMFYYLSKARCAAGYRDYDALSQSEKFTRLCWAISPAFTKMFKRLRKNTGAKFKYLLVAEAHKSGLPHYHALFHEKNPHKPLRYRALRAEWPHGFDAFKLAEKWRPAYVCKYLTKVLPVRVRASQHYGSGTDLDALLSIGYDINIREVDHKRQKLQF